MSGCKSPRELRITELADQVRRLSAEKRQCMSNPLSKGIAAMAEEMERLRAENERLLAEQKTSLSMSILKDAQRYRKVRRNITPRQLVDNGFRDGGDLAPSEAIEARIDWMVDEAMKE